MAENETFGANATRRRELYAAELAGLVPATHLYRKGSGGCHGTTQENSTR